MILVVLPGDTGFVGWCEIRVLEIDEGGRGAMIEITIPAHDVPGLGVKDALPVAARCQRRWVPIDAITDKRGPRPDGITPPKGEKEA